MENPLKNFGSRKKDYDKNEEKLGNYEEKLDKATAPMGHLNSTHVPSVMAHEISNAFLAIIRPENWVKVPYYNSRIKNAKSKLEIIYQKDEKEAHGLNDKYNELIKQAAETGDDSKLKEFEKNKLGMGEVSEKE